MKNLLLLLLLITSSICFGQENEKVTIIDFVQIQNGNDKEATYYYENNWKVLRKMAVEKGYIASYQLLKTPHTEEAPFDLMLITTYDNSAQYSKSEEHFDELIKLKGPLKLMNEKKPGTFRKIIFHKDNITHLEG